ncbi:hypothetical protein [Saccharospirillum salsuginis]|uniref:Uncharacterized protein n=1 Tax=Saccharospirillum salsuginis TaxID=418750 RepID=A0A918K6L9_9GAMM|nr:hypothetical protein [Saccharospirillum salsuginis]GGX52232.1 hypothetical protein GCM10007392_19450 [Saccharospirillum salsuginis]
MKFENTITADSIVSKIDRRAESFRKEEAKASAAGRHFRADMAAAYARQLERLSDDIRAEIAAHNEAAEDMTQEIAGAA